jgi:hypothetical protein
VVISAGFSGALQDQYRVGDLILATEVRDVEGGRWPATWPGELLPGEWQPPLHRGRLLTTTHLLGNPEDKGRLGKEHDAAAVDMETASVAERCARAAVPFGCVRVISDDVATALSPKLVALLSGDRVSPLAVLTSLAGSPRLGAELWRLARHTRLAAAQLGKALGELLTLTLPFPV